MPASKYTQAQRDEALALYATDGPTAVTEKFGIPKQTVMSWAKKDGVRTVRTARTHAATQARSVDLKLARTEAEIAEMELLRWEQEKALAVKRGTGKWRTLVKGVGGSEEIRSLDFIPPNDARAAAGTRNTSFTTATKLRDANASTDGGTTVGESLLDRLAADLHRRHNDG